MASDLDQIYNLVQFALDKSDTEGTDPGQVLRALSLAAGEGFATGGGRLISTSVNGKSFAFSVDPELSVTGFMTALRGARALVSQYAPAQLAALLATPRSGWGRVGFGGCGFPC